VNLFGWILTGLIAGSFAQRVTGFEKRGCLFTLVIGVTGAIIGGALFQAIGEHGIRDFSWWSLFVAFIGGCVFCLLLGFADRNRRSPDR
jgi:uncharacterized membrane protein YeaQ/YmgE (transglycosylase-associated protein family)